MALDDESLNDVMSCSMSIHIPWDLLNDNAHYKCPTAVNIQLSPKTSPRRSRRPSHSTKGQGQIAKGKDRTRLTMSCKETSESTDGCLSQKQLSSLRSSAMDKLDNMDPSVHNSTYLDVIEMVAAANEHLTDYTNPSELPELRTSPCTFHHRSHPNTHLSPHRRQSGNHQLLYASNFHAGLSPRSTGSKLSGSSDQNKESVETRIQMERSKLFQQDVRKGEKQTYTKPSLPQPMTSKDFIKSWLQHGSQPNGCSHFPDVITLPKPTNHQHTFSLKSTNHKTLSPRPAANHNTPSPRPANHNTVPCHSTNHNTFSPTLLNNRHILAPISHTVKNKKQKR